MTAESHRIVVAGGDLRQVWLAQILSFRGFQVTACGLCRSVEDEKIREEDSLRKALQGAVSVAAPVPFLRDGKMTGNGQVPDMDVKTLLSGMSRGSVLFGGNIPGDARERFRAAGIRAYDMMEDEQVAMRNTVATAEGAIAEAVSRSTCNLSGSRCMILGYGRCGSTLALLLRGFACRLSIVETDPARAAAASILAERVLSPMELEENIGDETFIFNTVPEMILNGEVLRCVKKTAWIFDLASAPGGADRQAAEALDLNLTALPGLPGRFSPETSAEILADYICSVLL